MSLADLMKKGSLRSLATVTAATGATDKPDSLPSVASVAPVNVATAQKQEPNDPAQILALVSTGMVSTLVSSPAPVLQDPDRWCSPHSTAMTGREIDTFTARQHHFKRRGLKELDAERLADKLVTRDREEDERRLCLECAHLAGHAGTWGCRNWQQAAIASQARDAQLSPAVVIQPQRCDGFKAAT